MHGVFEMRGISQPCRKLPEMIQPQDSFPFTLPTRANSQHNHAIDQKNHDSHHDTNSDEHDAIMPMPMPLATIITKIFAWTAVVRVR